MHLVTPAIKPIESNWLNAEGCLNDFQVRRFDDHNGTVNDLCFDEAAEFLASCSDDGFVVVGPLLKHLDCLPPVPVSPSLRFKHCSRDKRTTFFCFLQTLSRENMFLPVYLQHAI